MQPRSQNGYIANNPDLTRVYEIPRCNRHIRLRRGPAGLLLIHFALWFDQKIEPLDQGPWDDWGYAERPIRGSSTTLSNHASGTAMDLNATVHPMGKRGTFTDKQTRMIRNRLSMYGGCIRWGGDYNGRPDEMHFEINKSLSVVKRRWRMLRHTPRGRRIRQENFG